MFARDGDAVYFTRIENGVPSVWRVAALGGPARKVVERGRMPVPSPDGKSMAYLTWPAPSDLVVAALDGSASRVLQRQVRGGVGTERPQWSPDGRWLSYNRWQLFEPGQLWVVDAISGEANQVTAFKASSEGIASWTFVSRDGRTLVFRGRGRDLWPVWTPDGQWIVFGSSREGKAGMWRIRPSGGEPERIADGFFRGDLVDRPDGAGTPLVTTSQAEDQGLRLIDLSRLARYSGGNTFPLRPSPCRSSAPTAG
ncbi:MAG TPA: hypothetical protein VJ813_04490 [Vicinamibacterales bacterium]|nr:hypothetical protein [Vicinamibacterales bacterium]